MRRVLLLLPTATYRATDFLDAARALGVEVVVGCEQAQTMAAPERSIVVDLDHPEIGVAQVLDAHARHAINGVAAVDDQGLLVAAEVARRLGFPHNPVDAVRATRDKAAMRLRFKDAGVPQPAFQTVGSAAGDHEVDLGAVAAAAAAVGYPCVVKPVGLSASRGVIRADNEPQVLAAAARIQVILSEAGDSRPALIIEEFMPGQEVAVEAILRGGKLEVLAVFDKPDPLDGPYFEETIYVTPSRHDPAVVKRAIDQVGAAARALGLCEGPIHAELRLPGRVGVGAAPLADVVVLEVAARTIGGLCGRTLRFGAGVRLEEVVLRHALGLPSDELGREDAAAGVMMLPIPHRGTLAAVEGQDEARAVAGVVGLDITIPVGRPVVPLPEGDRYLGFLFARGETPAAVEDSLRQAHARLKVRIDAAPVA